MVAFGWFLGLVVSLQLSGSAGIVVKVGNDTSEFNAPIFSVEIGRQANCDFQQVKLVPLQDGDALCDLRGNYTGSIVVVRELLNRVMRLEDIGCSVEQRLRNVRKQGALGMITVLKDPGAVGGLNMFVKDLVQEGHSIDAYLLEAGGDFIPIFDIVEAQQEDVYVTTNCTDENVFKDSLVIQTPIILAVAGVVSFYFGFYGLIRGLQTKKLAKPLSESDPLHGRVVVLVTEGIVLLFIGFFLFTGNAPRSRGWIFGSLGYPITNLTTTFFSAISFWTSYICAIYFTELITAAKRCTEFKDIVHTRRKTLIAIFIIVLPPEATVLIMGSLYQKPPLGSFVHALYFLGTVWTAGVFLIKGHQFTKALIGRNSFAAQTQNSKQARQHRILANRQIYFMRWFTIGTILQLIGVAAFQGVLGFRSSATFTLFMVLMLVARLSQSVAKILAMSGRSRNKSTAVTTDEAASGKQQKRLSVSATQNNTEFLDTEAMTEP